MKTYKHLTQEERYTIDRMRKEVYNQARIAARHLTQSLH
ncbi:MAG: helix-turn-helix domain-containing protein [Puniceicoccaceae bacterium]|nr:helix-turn-helix domain-containing protein [Puniceicoccaceae bacterium]MBL6913564.1 helix-turn-helix domain-containing protein [Puniceicoccaceae bacterium]